MRGTKQQSSSPRSGPSESGLLGAFLGEKAIQRSEHSANVLAYRKGALIGLVAWVLFGLTDWFIVAFVEPGRLWVYITLRLIGALVLGAIVLRLHLTQIPSPRLLRLLDITAFTTASVLVSIACIELQGITSPLALGVITILITRSALVPDRWQRGLVPIGVTAAAHPFVLLILALFVPHMNAQLHDAQALGGFILNQLFIFGAATIGVIGSHKMWALRRQVYQARNIGRYKLKKRIGRGGMGEVWVAHHNTLDRDVAIKILRPDKMDDEAVLRFEREVRATSDLTHPNTVRVYDYGVTEDGLCYYAMELLDGENLATVLHDNGPLEPKRIVDIGLQVSGALAEAHSRGIIHRDLKPGNLILTNVGTEQQHVKVVDFGLALFSSPDQDSAVTHTGFIVGTPAYIAPELLTGRPADTRSDIYALGAVLYELLCGFPPFFDADSKRSLRLRSHHDAPPPSSVLGAELSPNLEALVLQTLRRDPDERYQTAQNLYDALSKCRLEEPFPKKRGKETDETTTKGPHKNNSSTEGVTVPLQARSEEGAWPSHVTDEGRSKNWHRGGRMPSYSCAGPKRRSEVRFESEDFTSSSAELDAFDAESADVATIVDPRRAQRQPDRTEETPDPVNLESSSFEEDPDTIIER